MYCKNHNLFFRLNRAALVNGIIHIESENSVIYSRYVLNPYDRLSSIKGEFF